jgi:hypothetical protein
MSTPEELQAAIAKERAERAATERENREVRKLVREVAPLWERIRLRRQQNGFGEDFEIAMTRRV